MVPSNQMPDVVCACFAKLDCADKFIARHNGSTIRESAESILETYSSKYIFTRNNTLKKGIYFAAKIVVNIFYNKVRKFTVTCF